MAEASPVCGLIDCQGEPVCAGAQEPDRAAARIRADYELLCAGLGTSTCQFRPTALFRDSDAVALVVFRVIFVVVIRVDVLLFL